MTQKKRLCRAAVAVVKDCVRHGATEGAVAGAYEGHTNPRRRFMLNTKTGLPLCAALFLGLAVLLGGCGSTTTSTSTGSAPAQPSSTGENPDPDTLYVALLPDQDAPKIIKNNEPLKKYLEEKLGKKIELKVTTNYSLMIEAARMNSIHLAFFGPVSYVQAKRECNIEPFAALINKGKPTYHSCIIAGTDSGIKELADIKGKKLALGDPLSTSSSYAPRYMLMKAGLREGIDYETTYVGKHDAVAKQVEIGNVPAGGLMKDYYLIMLEKKELDPAKVKLLATSDELVEFPWTMQSWLKPELKEKIRAAFLELKDPEVLKGLKNADGFAPVTDKDYAATREIVDAVDKMMEEVKKEKK
jgi:phosphonate transport system substrate-binding protein